MKPQTAKFEEGPGLTSRKNIGKTQGKYEKIREKKALSRHVKSPPTRVKATSIITGRISEKAIDKFRIIKT